MAERIPPPAGAASTGELVSQLSEQATRLVRDEIRLAQIEMSAKAKQAGIGAGLLGVAGVLALYGLGAGIVTGGIALGLVLPLWLAALIITVFLFVVAGIVALIGKKRVTEITPAPEHTIEGAKRAVDTVKKGVSDGRRS